MAANYVCFKFFGLICSLLICTSHCLNLGLISGDHRRLGSPLIIKKYSHKSPIFINVNKPLIPTLPPLPKLPKPPPSKLKSSLKKPRSLLPPLLPKPLLPPVLPPILPSLPRLPLLPLLPPILPPLPLFPPIIPGLPILPPIIPGLPILPPPFLTGLPKLKPLRLRGIKLPSLKTPLQKALGSELKPVIVPCERVDKGEFLGKLRELRKIGSLTTAEFVKFKKLLLKKK